MKRVKNSFVENYIIPFTLSFVIVIIIFTLFKPDKKNPSLPELAIILAPHFDDAVLPLGGFMAESKIPVIVITFFGGKPNENMSENWDKLSGFSNSEEAITARVKENILALKQTGAHPINLNYLDYQYNFDRDQTSREKLTLSIKKDVEIILKSFSSSEKISVYGPSEFGGKITHPDHKVVHDAMTEIVKLDIFKNAQFYFFEDFPYVERFQKSTTTPLTNFLKENNPDFKLAELSINISTTSLDKKISALNAYTSQDKAFSALGADITQSVRDFALKRCVGLIPAPYSCEVVYEINI